MNAQPEKRNNTSHCDFMLTSARYLGHGELVCYRLDRLLERWVYVTDVSIDEDDCCCRAA